METISSLQKKAGVSELGATLFLLGQNTVLARTESEASGRQNWLYSRKGTPLEVVPEETASLLVKHNLVSLAPDLQLPGVSAAFALNEKGEKNLENLIRQQKERATGAKQPEVPGAVPEVTAPPVQPAAPDDISEKLAAGAKKVRATKAKAAPAAPKPAPAKKTAAEKKTARAAKAPVKLKQNQKGNGREVYRFAAGGEGPKGIAPARDEYLSSVTVALARAARYVYKFGLPCSVRDESISPPAVYVVTGSGKGAFTVTGGPADGKGVVQPAPAKTPLESPKKAKRGTKKPAPTPVKPKTPRKGASSSKAAPAGKKASPAKKAPPAVPAAPAPTPALKKVRAPRTTRAKSAEEVRA